MRLTINLFWKITLVIGVVAALIGLSLRYFFVSPLPFNYQYMLHTHSHLMLLGWLFNAMLLLIFKQWNISITKVQKLLFLALFICIAGMLFSFPFQGYAAISIGFSTAHLWVSYVLLIQIWRFAKGKGLSGSLVKIGVVFFFLSSIGPYALGPLMANGMQSSPWYAQAIFFYLHFQYNGAFFFFLLAYIIQSWPSHNLRISQNTFLILMSGGALLTWFHSLDYSFDSIWINIAGGLGAILQIWGGIFLLTSIDRAKMPFTKLIILGMLALKWIVQLLGSFPEIAQAAVQNRFYLIAWLHFIFLGIFTPFIWSRFEQNIKHFNKAMFFYWTFFFLTEGALVLPSLYLITSFEIWPHVTFVLYIPFVLIWVYLATKAYTGMNRPERKLT